jgi:hypothetical protein
VGTVQEVARSERSVTPGRPLPWVRRSWSDKASDWELKTPFAASNVGAKASVSLDHAPDLGTEMTGANPITTEPAIFLHYLTIS